MSIFLNNKYTNIYYSIIDSAKNRLLEDYSENHHIIPKCFYEGESATGWLKGDCDENNTVDLTAREHFICHWLLTKMQKTKSQKNQMIFAFNMMRVFGDGHQRYIPSSRVYEVMRKEMTEMLKGVCYEERYGTDRAAEIKAKIGKKSVGRKPMLGKKHTKATKKILSDKKTGVASPKSDKMKAKLSATRKAMNLDFTGDKNPMFGKTQTQETKELISNANSGSNNGMFEKYKNAPIIKCPNCDKTGKDGPNFKRFHFENCKSKK